MLTRRRFLDAASNGLLLTLPSMRGLAASRVRIGCQTNAWRVDPADFNSLLVVLGKLKELGYDGFETGFRNVQEQFGNADKARKQIEQTGQQFFATHIFLDQYDPQTQIAPIDLVRKVVDGVGLLGAGRLILSGGGLVRGGKLLPQLLKRKADGLNEAARYCKSKGLRLAYHNHGPEFEAKGLEIEALYLQTDSSLVDFVMDCGWAFRGGADVPAFFARHHRRIAGLHLRDFKGDAQVPLGQGDFPLRALAAQIARTRWNGWVLNEEERLSGEKPGEKAVGPARQSLRQAFGK